MTSGLFSQSFSTPLGKMEICASDKGIRSVFFREPELKENPNQHTRMAMTQLQEYFAGQRTEFTLALDAQGTSFQKSVWRELMAIPYGHTCSYRDIASGLNKPTAMRAVGAANGKNPISIIVPCHRVIGATGKLTGYAGGLERKAKLLALENPQAEWILKEGM